MVCTASDLQEWKDFPKGLRVLLLDEDIDSASEIRSKLEEMDYIVSTFCNEDEALLAVSTKPESFHVAIIEVNISNSNESFKFLENTKDLPTIMTSNIHCLSTMMKCIALGAVEFLHKPLSEDKLRNIWQHVVHKAFNAGGSSISESPKPVKESIVSMMQLQLESEAPKENVLIKPEIMSRDHDNDHEKSAGNEKYPAPSTPQLKQVARSLDDGDCHYQANCSTEKESGEQDGESKSVETTCDNSMALVIPQTDKPQEPNEIVVKKENDSADGCMAEITESPPNPRIKDSARCLAGAPENTSKAPGLSSSCLTKANRKKTKVDWTPELHKKFVQAVEQLGVDQTIPSRILELMKVDGLTRHNVASHLQKYRMQRRHILPKEDDRKWPHPRDPMQRNYFPNKPIMAYPPYHPNIAIQTGPVYPVWGAPSNHQGGVHMWGPTWQPTESWHWKPPHLGIQGADAWGCPVMPPPSGPCSPFPQNVPVYHSPRAVDNSFSMPQGSFDLQPAEEVIDRVVKEAINKPWLPLPIGLRPPATDSVLAELSRQGISSIPPHTNNPNSY